MSFELDLIRSPKMAYVYGRKFINQMRLDKILFASLSMLLGSNVSAWAQNPMPDTEIYLLDIKKLSKKSLVLGEPRNITNRVGYDNQPSFSPDGKSVYFTSIRDQADVYRYDIESGANTRITETKEDEYSPQVTPDGLFVSVVRVEADSTQRVWKFPLAGGEPSLVLKKVDSVGYYCWMSGTMLGLIIITEPMTLHLGYINQDTSWQRCSHAGRSLQKVPKKENTIAFVDKTRKSDTADCIFTYHYAKSPEKVVRVLPGSEDFAYLPDGSIIMGNEGKLYRYNPRHKKAGWVFIADYSQTPVGKFYRLAASPDGKHIALVGYSGKKP